MSAEIVEVQEMTRNTAWNRVKVKIYVGATAHEDWKLLMSAKI